MVKDQTSEALHLGVFLGLSAVVVGTVVLRGGWGQDTPEAAAASLPSAVRTLPAPTVTVTGSPRIIRVPSGTKPAQVAAAAGPGAPAAAAPVAAGTAGPGTTGPRTLVGKTYTNEFGPVQVKIVVTGTHIDDVVALQVPVRTERDRQINKAALPQLHDQVIIAQSARIDGVSGATITSVGYAQSVQSALDQL